MAGPDAQRCPIRSTRYQGASTRPSGQPGGLSLCPKADRPTAYRTNPDHDDDDDEHTKRRENGE
jgi:hypothetical protein